MRKLKASATCSALKNKVPLDERDDWGLPNVTEEYKHGIVEPLRVQ